jgi:hypothetical protein
MMSDFLEFSAQDQDQLISKGLFGILNSSQKCTKKFNFTTMIPQVNFFLFVFWKNLMTPKDILKLTDLY